MWLKAAQPPSLALGSHGPAFWPSLTYALVVVAALMVVLAEATGGAGGSLALMHMANRCAWAVGARCKERYT